MKPFDVRTIQYSALVEFLKMDTNVSFFLINGLQLNCFIARNIISIKKAIESQHDKLQNAMRKAQKIEQQLVSTRAKVENHLKDVDSTQHALITTISSIYDSLIDQLIKRKEMLIQEVKDVHDSEQIRWNMKINEINQQVSLFFLNIL